MKLPGFRCFLLVVILYGTTQVLPFSASAQPIRFDAKLIGVVSDPSSPGVLYASSVGGILRSDNSGQTWVQIPVYPLGEQQPSFQPVLFDYANPSTIYAYVRGGIAGNLAGAWRSHDRGAHWERIVDETSFAADSKLEAILVAPSNGSVLYANTTLNGASRIYRSDNGGSTWSYKGEGLIRAVSPASSETVYQASNGSVHRSANGGQSWTTVGTIRNTTGSLDGIAGLAISPGNPNLMLATMSGPIPPQMASSVP